MIRSFVLSDGRYLRFRSVRVCPLTGDVQDIKDARDLSPSELDRSMKDFEAFKTFAELVGEAERPGRG